MLAEPALSRTLTWKSDFCGQNDHARERNPEGGHRLSQPNKPVPTARAELINRAFVLLSKAHDDAGSRRHAQSRRAQFSSPENC
jgi:hypothetical protein